MYIHWQQGQCDMSIPKVRLWQLGRRKRLMANNGRLDARDRAPVLDRLARTEFDVLVIGGGVTGAGAALDAASRGLRVALVEARDLASGTSSRSSKPSSTGACGTWSTSTSSSSGKRSESATCSSPSWHRTWSSRSHSSTRCTARWSSAPTSSTAWCCMTPWEGTKRPVPHHRHLTVRGALRLAPALKPSGLAGALLYYDAQADDARYTLTVARTAAAHGALIATQVSARELLRSPDGARVTGARVHDEESGRDIDVSSRRVVVCAGVWTDLVHELSGVQAGQLHLAASTASTVFLVLLIAGVLIQGTELRRNGPDERTAPPEVSPAGRSLSVRGIVKSKKQALLPGKNPSAS